MIRGACLAATLAMAAVPAGAASLFPATYDPQIRQAAERYWPGVPWQLWKAQLYQESRLDPRARSPAGAEGLAQFMPSTWAEISKALGYGVVDRRLAGPAIEGGAYYMATLRRRWPEADLERQRFAAASYNAGLGNVHRAFVDCGAAGTWQLTSGCLSEVTGQHAAETIGYVRQIWRWFAVMEAGR